MVSKILFNMDDDVKKSAGNESKIIQNKFILKSEKQAELEHGMKTDPHQLMKTEGPYLKNMTFVLHLRKVVG